MVSIWSDQRKGSGKGWNEKRQGYLILQNNSLHWTHKSLIMFICLSLSSIKRYSLKWLQQMICRSTNSSHFIPWSLQPKTIGIPFLFRLIGIRLRRLKWTRIRVGFPMNPCNTQYLWSTKLRPERQSESSLLSPVMSQMSHKIVLKKSSR